MNAAAAAKSLQSCLTLWDPIDGSPPGSPVPGILQARTLEWVAMSFSNAWKWKVKWSRSVMSNPQWPHGLQPTRHPWNFPGKSTGVGCHCLLWDLMNKSALRHQLLNIQSFYHHFKARPDLSNQAAENPSSFPLWFINTTSLFAQYSALSWS